MVLSTIEREAIRQMNRKKEKVTRRTRKILDALKDEDAKHIRKIKSQPGIKKQCDDLWIEIIKAKAGYKSEISGRGRKEGIQITSHHIAGKPNFYLRYLLENGICLENHEEHIFGVHNKFDPVKSNEMTKKIIKKIGEERYEQLCRARKRKGGKGDYQAVKIYLQQELKKYKR